MTTTRLRDDTDTARTARGEFVLGQVRGLRPLDFVTFITPSKGGFTYVEISRDEHEDVSTVEVGGAPAPNPTVGGALEALGFNAPDPGPTLRWKGGDADQVGSLVTSVLDGPLAVAADAPPDVHHGNRRAEIELARKLDRIRERIRSVAGAALAADAVTQDADGDLVLSFESTRVWVGTRVLGGTEIVVHVFALAAAEVDPSPALALFLAQANFALAIGKFSLDVVRRVVWFEEALLGEEFTDLELRRVIQIVALTTDKYDDQITHMFGGRTAREAARTAPDDQQHEKPGSSGYL